MSVETLLGRLEGVRPAGQGSWTAKCPAHADRTPSLSVREEPDGRVLLNCHAGCGAIDVLESIGMGWSDVFPEPLPVAEKRQGIPASWALEVLEHEALLVGIVASDIAAGKVISEQDAVRVAQAAGRIASIAGRVYGR